MVVDLLPAFTAISPAIAYSQPFEALGGYRREEAIMQLRRFYITENTHGACTGSLSVHLR